LDYYNAVKLGIQVNLNEIPVHIFELMKKIDFEINEKTIREMKK